MLADYFSKKNWGIVPPSRIIVSCIGIVLLPVIVTHVLSLLHGGCKWVPDLAFRTLM